MQKRVSMLVAALIGWILVEPTRAHVGPPFPILSDQNGPGYVLSIWADPDIGEALFYVVMEPPEGQGLPAVSAMEFWVEPVSGRLPRKSYAMNQQKARRHLRYVATPELDKQEFWKVGVEIKLMDGRTSEFTAGVESTPPGLGAWDLLVYVFPFVLFGALWARMMVGKGRVRSAR